MNKKRIIILFVIIFLIAFIAFIITYINNVKTTSQVHIPPAPKYLVDPPPRIIEVPEIPNGAVFTYSGPDKTIPTSLPVYGFTELTDQGSLYTIGNTVSSTFGFISSPSAIVNGDYFAYTKNSAHKTFSLSKTNNMVSITYQRTLVEDTSLFVEATGQTLSSFLTSLLSLPNEVSLYPITMDKTVFDGVLLLERPTPKVTNYGFGISLNDYPLLTRENTKRWASALIDERGAIRIFNYILPPAVTRGESVQIISPNDAVANINIRRADILWITNTSGDYGLAPSFTSGVLSDYSIVYVYKNNALVPAYLFEGSGKTQNGDTQTFEVLVLAVPSSR